jgi:hypothetical protein
MKKFIKKYFIPHEENEYKPHFFRSGMTVMILSGILLLEIIFVVQAFVILPRTNQYASILPSIVFDLTNKNREAVGESYLTENPILAKAAQMKAEDMARRGYFSHNDPNGEAPWEWFTRAGYDFLYAGENLAVNYVDSEDVVHAWMKSETHKKNILNAKFSQIGVGVARGKYEGKDVLFIVQFFGTPVQAAIKNSSVTTKPNNVVVASNGTPPSVSQPQLQSQEQETVYTAFIKSLFLFPRAAISTIYLVLITMISLAFMLMIFIKFHIQHSHLIINGAVMLLFIGSLLVLNQYLLLSQIKIF